MIRKQHGQETIEFALIGGLVFVVGIGSIIIFGDKMAKFFMQDSAVIASSKASSQILASDSNSLFTPDYQTDIPYNEELIAGQSVRTYDDGRVVINVDGSSFTLNSKAVNLVNVAMEAAGASGLEDIVTELAYLVKTYGVKPEEVEVWGGNGTREFNISYDEKEKKGLTGLFGNDIDKNYSSATVLGKAKLESTVVNAFALKVDNHIIVIQKDQECSGKFCPFQGKYRIEGDVDENNNFVANFTNDNEGIEGTYATKLNMSEGLIFEKSDYEQNKEYKECTTKKVRTGLFKKKNKTLCNTASNVGKWNLNFTNTLLKFGFK